MTTLNRISFICRNFLCPSQKKTKYLLQNTEFYGNRDKELSAGGVCSYLMLKWHFEYYQTYLEEEQPGREETPAPWLEEKTMENKMMSAVWVLQMWSAS